MAKIEGQQYFTALPNWIFKKQIESPGWLSCSELSVLFALQFFANGTNSSNGVYPSYKTICMYANVSKRTAVDCIKSLEEKGLIQKETRGDENGQTSNIYFLNIWNHEPPASLGHPDPRCSDCTPPVQILHPPGANSAPEQEPMNKKRKNPPLSPLAPRSTRKAVPELPELPDFAKGFSEQLESWWAKRCRKHKNATSALTANSIAALQLAKELGVLKEFCDEASEKDWMSLGFAGYTDYLQRLSRDKSFATNGGQPVYKVKSTVNMDKHPSYRPLVSEDDDFF
jgi:hypothetical protein